MGESREVGKQKSEGKEEILIPVIIVSFIASALLVYYYANRAWLPAFQQIVAWFIHPTVNYTPVGISGISVAFLATVEVLFVGFTFSYLLLGNEKDNTIKLLTIAGLGFGITGLATIILGVMGNLFVLPLNILLLVPSAICLSLLIYKRKTTQNLTLRQSLTPKFPSIQFKLPSNIKFWLPPCIAIAVIYIFSTYHALLTPILHWDATVYHAVMPVFMFRDHAIPVIAGPSIGIEMSANFPPLFPAVGAYYYIQMNAIEDFFLRGIAPIMGFLAVITTYKIGEILAGKKYGLIAALFLSITPLFFRYSIYATNYSTLTFFCTISVLFLLLAMTKGDTKYWIGGGAFFGFAVLTSYIALYLAPFLLIALLALLVKRRAFFGTNFKKAVLLLCSAIAVGGVWYLRNWIVVGNPIYPNAYQILGGINIDPLIMDTTNNGIKYSAQLSFFGGEISLFERIMMFLVYRTHFPAISLLTILGLAIIPTMNRKFWLVALWPLSLSALVLSGIAWGFPRHVVFALPGFALLSALPIIKLLESAKKFDFSYFKSSWQKLDKYLPAIRKGDIFRVSLVVMLLFAFLFPSLTLVMAGKVHSENQDAPIPPDYLYFLENPNSDTWVALNKSYSEAIAWQYMNDNLKSGEKAATIENRIYYVKNCSNEYFFYLDGWEARDLYNTTDPQLMIQLLRGNNVTFIVDVAWARLHGHFAILPMAQFLGSAYFPTIVDHLGNPNIYNVGSIESPITNNSRVPVSINLLGWSEVQLINGVQCQSVIAGNDSVRLFVNTPNATSLAITFLDAGKGSFSVNVHTGDNQWILDYAVVQKNNTGTWKTCQFLAPSEGKFVEMGLHAFDENFTISRIEAKPYLPKGNLTR